MRAPLLLAALLVTLLAGAASAQTTPRTTAFAHNYIAVNDGTPLGIHPSRRPQS